MIPDVNALLPTPNPTWKNMARWEFITRRGIDRPFRVGLLSEEARSSILTGIKAVSIEMACTTTMSKQCFGNGTIPILVMFGDHLGTCRDVCFAVDNEFRYLPQVVQQ